MCNLFRGALRDPSAETQRTHTGIDTSGSLPASSLNSQPHQGSSEGPGRRKKGVIIPFDPSWHCLHRPGHRVGPQEMSGWLNRWKKKPELALCSLGPGTKQLVLPLAPDWPPRPQHTVGPQELSVTVWIVIHPQHQSHSHSGTHLVFPYPPTPPTSPSPGQAHSRSSGEAK